MLSDRVTRKNSRHGVYRVPAPVTTYESRQLYVPAANGVFDVCTCPVGICVVRPDWHAPEEFTPPLQS